MKPMTLFSSPTLVLMGASFLAVGCAGREVPVRFAAQSALSSNAREAPVADPTVALTSDPPLPGEATGAWLGLAPDGGVSGVGGPSHAH
jgi:hypothetical protein